MPNSRLQSIAFDYISSHWIIVFHHRTTIFENIIYYSSNFHNGNCMQPNLPVNFPENPTHDHWRRHLGLRFDSFCTPLPCFRCCRAGSFSWLPLLSSFPWLVALSIASSSCDNSDRVGSSVIAYIIYNPCTTTVFSPLPSSSASALAAAALSAAASSLARRASWAFALANVAVNLRATISQA